MSAQYSEYITVAGPFVNGYTARVTHNPTGLSVQATGNSKAEALERAYERMVKAIEQHARKINQSKGDK